MRWCWCLWIHSLSAGFIALSEIRNSAVLHLIFWYKNRNDIFQKNIVTQVLAIKIIVYAHWLTTTSWKGRSPTLTVPGKHQNLLSNLLKTYFQTYFLNFWNNSKFFRCAPIFFLERVEFFAPSMWWIKVSLRNTGLGLRKFRPLFSSTAKFLHHFIIDSKCTASSFHPNYFIISSFHPSTVKNFIRNISSLHHFIPPQLNISSQVIPVWTLYYVMYAGTKNVGNWNLAQRSVVLLKW